MNGPPPLPLRIAAAVFLPFAAGYFLSYFFRNVNAVIAKDLAGEFGLSPAGVGLLTSAYFIAFAAAQLPVGVLLDRYGPRRVVATLLCVAAIGAFVFGRADGAVALALGRALIGLGVAACLMGSIKAFTLWFPLERLATVIGWFLFLGTIGGIAATTPVELAVGTIGWRAMFVGLAAGALAISVLIFLAVPERPLPGAGATWGEQFGALGAIFGRALFWRLSLPFVVTHGAYQAMQGLWLGPWLIDVGGFDRAMAAHLLLLGAAAYAIGSLAFGTVADRLDERGWPRLATYKLGIAASVAMFFCIALDLPLPRAAVMMAYSFTVMSGALVLAIGTRLFPPAMSGRVVTAMNFLMFGASFACQWGIGAVLRAFPVDGGRYAPEGYGAALLAIGALQVAALAWLLPLRLRPGP